MSTRPFAELPGVLEKYAVQIAEIVNLVAQRAALAGGDALARETPVDTGEARSNWVLTLDSPFVGKIPPYFPYPSYRVHHHEAVKSLAISVRRPKARVSMSGSGPRTYGVL